MLSNSNSDEDDASNSDGDEEREGDCERDYDQLPTPSDDDDDPDRGIDEAELLQRAGMKPFPCKKCNLSYRTRAGLSKHDGIAHKGKKFYCTFPGCSEFCHEKFRINDHMRRVHKNVDCTLYESSKKEKKD